jgi:hypothetical protein
LSPSSDELPAPPSITTAQANEVIAVVVAAFDDVISSGAAAVPSTDEARLKCVFGWWAWINRSSKLVQAAFAADLGHEAAPNIRTILEHTLALLWVLDEGDEALAAVDAAWSEGRRKLYGELVAAGWAIPPGVSQPDRTTHPKIETIRHFINLCLAYRARTLYVPYRMLSTHVHPSAKGAAAYLTEQGELADHAAHPAGDHLVLVALCLIWAAQGMNGLLGGQPLAAALTRTVEIVGQVDRPQLR